jgi:hypothetical protein
LRNCNWKVFEKITSRGRLESRFFSTRKENLCQILILWRLLALGYIFLI